MAPEEINPRNPYPPKRPARLHVLILSVLVGYVAYSELTASTSSLVPANCNALRSTSERKSPLPGNLSQTEERYLTLLEGVVTGSAFPEAGRCQPPGCSNTTAFDAQARLGGNDWPPIGHTMAGTLRVRNVRVAIEHVVSKGIEGDFLELGVWRGGLCLYARAVLNVLGQAHRKVVVADAFDVMKSYGDSADYLAVTETQVRDTFSRFGLSEGVEFVKGLFRDTLGPLSAARDGAPIAVLRIDANFYASYVQSFYYFFDAVPVGGVIIFDDIRSHPDVQRAWADFQRDQGFSETLIPIAAPDKHASWFIKTARIVTDHAKMPSNLPDGR